MQDASWYPNHTTGGGLVVADPMTGLHQTYWVPIPVNVDESYQAQPSVAWDMLRARGAHRVVSGTQGLQWSFHDSKGYIGAVRSRNPGCFPLSDDVLSACPGLLAEGFFAPQHPYSQRVGTFLESLLDLADGEAKKQAARARPKVGWIRGLQVPRVRFPHNKVQVHKLDCLVETAARRLWGLHIETLDQVVRKFLAVCHHQGAWLRPVGGSCKCG